MNEAETRAQHIDPALKAAGWGVAEGSRVRREYVIAGPDRRQGPSRETADCRLHPGVSQYEAGRRRAKAWDEQLSEGAAQAKNYAAKLAVRAAFSSNGQGIYGIDMQTGRERDDLTGFPTPEELWNLTFAGENAWRDRFAAVPFEDKGGMLGDRYFRDIAIERVLEAIANGTERILLTLATGTGKTMIAFQIAWKLFHSRWNLSREATGRPQHSR